MSTTLRVILLVVLVLGVWAATRKSNVSEGSPPPDRGSFRLERPGGAPDTERPGGTTTAERPGGATTATAPREDPPEVDANYPGITKVPRGEEREAVRAMLRLIERGPPFRYPKDGTVFMNREGRLPKAPREYYREYTVPTPGSPDRGARRIIAGGRARYYTRDHYEHFVELTP